MLTVLLSLVVYAVCYSHMIVNMKASALVGKTYKPTFFLSAPFLNFPPLPQSYSSVASQVIAKMKGSELVGKTYKPMFPFFESLKAQPGSDTGSFRVVSDTYVTADAGTGIVHQAPFFGEDDYRVCRKFGERTA